MVYIHFKRWFWSQIYIFPIIEFCYNSGIDIVLVKKRSFCSGDRHELYESDTLGLETLTKCAESALSDERCDGTGYFDTAVRGGAYQCKCTGGGACLTNAKYESNWSIYLASYSG